jgi:hypothetical protein
MRHFTEDEDRLILSNARSEISLYGVMRELKCSREAVERRARELGVKPSIKRWDRKRLAERRRRLEEETFSPQHAYDGKDPYRIKEDGLLQRLFEHHGDRRYAELKERGVRST